MPAAADLEVGLSRDDGKYVIDLRLTPPDAEAEIRLMRDGPMPVAIDPEALRALSDDDEAYADALATAVFGDPVIRQSFAKALAATEALNTTLRVRLAVQPDARELHGVHWERLRDPETKSLLFTGDAILFSRYLSSLDFRPVRLRPKVELRALVAVANPAGIGGVEVEGRPLAPLDAAREIARARAALAPAIPVTALSQPVTLQAIADELRDGYDILYLACHGELRDGQPHIYLEDESGGIADVPGDELVNRLTGLLQLPRLVMLASCESAGDGVVPAIADNGTLAALGPLLAEAGIPAVIAMQGKVSIETASGFMEAFFRELSRSGEIDRATAVGRYAVCKRPDWWMPVLFMRLKSGRIYWYDRGFTSEKGNLRTWPSLIRHITNGKCTPIMGAGLFDALLGSRERIARHLAEQVGFPLAPYGRNSLSQVAQFLTVDQDREFARATVIEAFCRALWERNPSVSGAGAQPDFQAQSTDQNVKHLITMSQLIWQSFEGDASEPYRVLAGLNLPLYLTATNGNLLTYALKAEGKQPETLIAPWNQEALEFESVYQREPSYQPTPERPLVYHLFGSVEVPDTLVLTEDDYLDYLIGVTKNRDRIPPRVRRATSDASLLFLGFRLDDWDFRVLFRSILDPEGKFRRGDFVHVAAQVDPEEGRFIDPAGARTFFERYIQDAAIDVYWGTVKDFTRELSTRWHSAPRRPAPRPLQGAGT
jgi:hypothetical protein